MKERRHHNNEARRKIKRGKLKKDADYFSRKYISQRRQGK